MNNKTFRYLFYIALATSSVNAILIFPFWGWILYFAAIFYFLAICRSGRTYKLLFLLMLTSPPLGLAMLLPVLSFIFSTAYEIYLLIAIISLIFGVIYGALFNEITDNPKKFILPPAMLSLVISISTPATSIFFSVYSNLIQKSMQAYHYPDPTYLFFFQKLMPKAIPNVTLCFILFFLLFNTPFIILYFKRGYSTKYLLLYLVPITIYFALFFLFKIFLTIF